MYVSFVSLLIRRTPKLDENKTKMLSCTFENEKGRRNWKPASPRCEKQTKRPCSSGWETFSECYDRRFGRPEACARPPSKRPPSVRYAYFRTSARAWARGCLEISCVPLFFARHPLPVARKEEDAVHTGQATELCSLGFAVELARTK